MEGEKRMARQLGEILINQCTTDDEDPETFTYTHCEICGRQLSKEDQNIIWSICSQCEDEREWDMARHDEYIEEEN